MNDPATFSATSSRHALPFLFAGQAQKEFTVNEALAKIDVLLHPVVQGRVTSEPLSPEEGDCFLVTGPATGIFTGHEDRLASWDGQQWSFLDPAEGMVVHENASGFRLAFASGWQAPPSVGEPSGGATVDVEARDAIAALASALRNFGIIS